MSSVKSWEELRSDYREAMWIARRPVGNKLPPNHIFNEDETVKWNKEKVEAYNREYDLKVAELESRREKALEKVNEDILDKICHELKISRDRASCLWEYISLTTKHDNLEILLKKLEDLVTVLYAVFRC